MAEPRTAAPGLPGEDGPSIATVQEAPIVAGQVTPPNTGFQLLSEGLNQFFGQAEKGLDAVAKASDYVRMKDIQANYYLQRAEIQKEAKQSTELAKADALSGKPMDPAQAKNFAYSDTYQKTAGVQHGYEMARQFMEQVYPHLAPGQSATVAADGFLKDQFGTGTGVPGYDANALATFKSQLDRPIMAHIENSAKAVAAQGFQQLQSSIYGDTQSGKFNAGSIAGYIDQAKALNPSDPAKAAPLVGQMIRQMANGNPQVSQQILAELDKPGSSGTPGRSYHEMFPDAFQQLESGLTEHVVQGRSLAGVTAWSDLSKRADTATGVQDWLDPTSGILANANKLYQQYGGLSHQNTFWAKAGVQLKKLAATQVGVNQMDQMAPGGAVQVDQKVIDKNWDSFTQAKGFDPYQNPEQAASYIAKWNVAPSNLKNNMSTMLIDPNNPQGQATAVRFYNAIKQAYGGDPAAAKQHMSEDAKPVFDMIDQQMATSGDPSGPGVMDNILSRVDQNLAQAREANKIPWHQITGDTDDAKAQVTAMGTITKAIQGSGPWSLFHSGALSGTGYTPNIDWATQRDLLTQLKKDAILRSGNGKVDLQSVADETMKNLWASGRAELLPGEGGTVMFRVKPDNSTPALSPSAINPSNGKPEDTLSTYQSDLKAVSQVIPGLIDDPKNISVNPNAPTGIDGARPQNADGVYWLQRNGTRMTIGLGQDLTTLEVGPEKLGATRPNVKSAVPADPKEALTFLHGVLPDNRGLVLVPNDPVAPTAFWLGYRPRFTGAPPIPGPLPTEIENRRHEDYQAVFGAPRAGASENNRQQLGVEQ